ncbi:MAG TPA: glutathione S-transferase family protein [Polyangiaceae bacterium]|nr:glutathione S-transferase family protein [Polyangiaceae bacterium]
MELHSREISPFAARVRVSILAKELPVRIIDNPNVASDDFGKLNPLRRVPVLILDDGSVIPESDTIVEYLEDAYPSRPLRPADPGERAQVRLIARVAELYVFPAAVPIFSVLAAPDPARRDQLFAALDNALGIASSFLRERSGSWHAWGDRLTTADGALAPFLFYVQFLGQACGRAPLARYPRLQQFWEGAQQEPVLAKVTAQIAQALHARRGA